MDKSELTGRQQFRYDSYMAHSPVSSAPFKKHQIPPAQLFFSRDGSYLSILSSGAGVQTISKTSEYERGKSGAIKRVGPFPRVPVGLAKVFLTVSEYVVLDSGSFVLGDSKFSRATRSKNECDQN